MGHSVLTYRNEIERIISHWRHCFPNLNKENREAFDRVLVKGRRHADAAVIKGSLIRGDAARCVSGV